MTARPAYSAAEIGTLYRDDDRPLDQKYGLMVAPYFRIEISDQEDEVIYGAEAILEDGAFDLEGIIVNGVEWEEDIEGADALTLTLNNPDFSLADSRLFAEGNSVDLFMGYDGRPSFFMGRGIIVEIEPEFPAEGMPTIKIVGYDKSYFMMEEGRAEIVPEGSEWYERRRQSSQQRTPLSESRQVINNYRSGGDLTDEQIAENDRLNQAFEEAGDTFSIPNMGVDAAVDQGVDVGQERIEGRNIVTTEDGVIVRGEVEEDWDVGLHDDDYDRELRRRNVSRMGWQRQRFGRRNRRAGKVWRGKTDSEIVDAIFQSYEIVPYTEATNERRRVSSRVRPRGEINSQISSVTERPGIYRAVTERESRVERFRESELTASQIREIEESEDTPFDEVDESGQALPRQGDYIATPMNDTQASLTAYRVEMYSDIDTEDIRYRAFAGDNLSFLPLPDPEEYYNEPVETTPTRAPTPTRQREVTQKAGTTDWDFINKLARQHGFITFVFFHYDSRRWVGYWGPDNNIQQSREFIFRYNDGDDTSLGSIRPNLSMKNQSTEIELIYVDPVSRKTNRLRVNMENVSDYSSEFRGPDGSREIQEPVGDGPEVTLMIHGQRVQTHANRRFTSAEDARQWLMSFWLEHAQDFIHLDGDTIIGIPELRAREFHQFEGLRRFSGRYFVSMARHSMSVGQKYSTNFIARKVVNFQGGDEAGDDMLTVDQTTLGESEPESETI